MDDEIIAIHQIRLWERKAKSLVIVKSGGSSLFLGVNDAVDWLARNNVERSSARVQIQRPRK